MSRSLVAFALITIAATGQTCNGQLVRIPRTRITIPLPHTVGNANKAESEPPWYQYAALLGVGLAGLLAFAVMFTLVDWLRSGRRCRAVIRIIVAPSGEAPDEVRAAWVGLELPLIGGKLEAERLTAEASLSCRKVTVPSGYAVDGNAALVILESACPAAADWWRTHCPHVAVSGYQFVFSAEVCEPAKQIGRE